MTVYGTISEIHDVIGSVVVSVTIQKILTENINRLPKAFSCLKV